MPLPDDNIPIELPPNMIEGRELRWDGDDGPYYMIVNLTEPEVRALVNHLNSHPLKSIRRRLKHAIRNGLCIQHLDEFKGAAIEPLDSDEIDQEAE